MRFFFFSSTILSAGLSFTSAYAEITPEEAWAAYETMMTSTGMEVTADVSREGDTLVVRDMVYGMELGSGDMKVSSTSTAPEIRFQERAGGTVATWFASPITSIATTPLSPEIGDGMIETRSVMTIDGETLIEGDTDDMMFSFEEMTVSMVQEPAYYEEMLIQPGGEMTVGGIAGTYSLANSGVEISSEFDVTVAALTYDMVMDDPEGSVQFQMLMQDISVDGLYSAPIMDEAGSFADVFGAATLTMTSNSSESGFTMDMVLPDVGPISVTGSSQHGGTNISLASGLIDYEASADALEISVSGAVIPFGEQTVSIASLSSNLMLPLSASDADQPFNYGVGIEELVLPDFVWMMADPSGQLPHDPVYLRLAIAGTVQSGIDLFDIEALAALDGPGAEVPLSVKTVAIPELYLSLAGASIDGVGEGYFMGDQSITAGGLPPFAGKLNLDIRGIQTLLGTLASTGMLPPEQLMSAQMMLGVIARPGSEEDQLVSEIEITEDGTVLTNGQPLPF
ncbi:DUF2125 domain-containing protein [Celeribacter litoreus]|uniref:DUF2125 domain-containing protein n=1 Tax=Celeribacter litoreus TaxID=2876714 RepID=UPI001CC94F2D|nr:DUF2125 domain-containing protein [Celeribacter litoreus]MCA0041935.1 DUF2125 domain-containing protein [Celeribacter litoreus]